MGGLTNEIGLDWIKHFELHTQVSESRVDIDSLLDGHDSHHSTELRLFKCQDHNIITLCMPPSLLSYIAATRM